MLIEIAADVYCDIWDVPTNKRLLFKMHKILCYTICLWLTDTVTNNVITTFQYLGGGKPERDRKTISYIK